MSEKIYNLNNHPRRAIVRCFIPRYLRIVQIAAVIAAVDRTTSLLRA